MKTVLPLGNISSFHALLCNFVEIFLNHDVRKENDLSWIRPRSDHAPLDESGAAEIVNIHRVVGYGKKLTDNKKVLEKIERLQGQISWLERELELPSNEIRNTERNLQSRINEERVYREKSLVVNGERKLSERDAQILKSIQKEINSHKRKIKKIEKDHENKTRRYYEEIGISIRCHQSYGDRRYKWMQV